MKVSTELGKERTREAADRPSWRGVAGLFCLSGRCLPVIYDAASRDADVGWAPPTLGYPLTLKWWARAHPTRQAGFAYPGTGETPVPLIGGDVVGGGP
jgi:hypothetical protein